MKTNFELGETKEYQMFKTLDHNRSISEKNVSKILSSIKEQGIQCPIVVDSRGNIVDGQHRLEALRRLNMVVPYIISYNWGDDKSISKLQEGLKWNSLDYCKSNASKGNIECQTALRLISEVKKANIKITPVVVLSIAQKGKSVFLSTNLKNNTYKVNEDVFNTILSYAEALSNNPMGTNAYGQKILRPLKFMHYDSKTGLDLEALELTSKMNYIQAFSNEQDQVKYLTDIYNKSCKTLKIKGI